MEGTHTTSQQSFEKLGFATIAVHSDRGVENLPDIAPPLHITSVYATENSDNLVYTRYDNPTRRRAEKVIGALEGGHAVLYSSGQAATAALLSFIKPKIVASTHGYHGTHQLLEEFKEQTGDVTLLEVEEYAKLGKGDLLWLETPSNPKCAIYDIKKHSEEVHKVGSLVVVDGTFASPVLQRALDLGADFVFHSCTKYLGGHSDILMGVVITKDEETAKKLRSQRSLYGNTPGSLETFLLLRSLRTLSLRVHKQAENAKAIAEFLSTQPKIAVVHHPCLPSHPGYELAKKQMLAPHSPPCFSIELRTEAAARELVKHLELFEDATSLGGVESTIDWRHRWDKTQFPGLLRVSVGVEEVEDLIEDFRQALDKLSEN